MQYTRVFDGAVFISLLAECLPVCYNMWMWGSSQPHNAYHFYKSFIVYKTFKTLVYNNIIQFELASKQDFMFEWFLIILYVLLILREKNLVCTRIRIWIFHLCHPGKSLGQARTLLLVDPVTAENKFPSKLVIFLLCSRGN